MYDILSGKRALVCAEEGVIVMQVKHALAQAGASVIDAVSTPEQLLRTSKEARPDFTIVDAYNADLPAVVRELREIRASPIFVLSSVREPTAERKLYQTGVCGVIYKPVISEEILALLADGLKRCSDSKKTYFQDVPQRPSKSLAEWRFELNTRMFIDAEPSWREMATTVFMKSRELRRIAAATRAKSRDLRERSSYLLSDSKALNEVSQRARY